MLDNNLPFHYCTVLISNYIAAVQVGCTKEKHIKRSMMPSSAQKPGRPFKLKKYFDVILLKDTIFTCLRPSMYYKFQFIQERAQ